MFATFVISLIWTWKTFKPLISVLMAMSDCLWLLISKRSHKIVHYDSAIAYVLILPDIFYTSYNLIFFMILPSVYLHGGLSSLWILKLHLLSVFKNNQQFMVTDI